jgi:hypothetical protein
LGDTDQFPIGLWRFVPYDHLFPSTNSPWSAPTNLCESDLLADATGKNFVAIKLGDVNDSWTAPALRPAGDQIVAALEARAGTVAAQSSLAPVRFQVSSHAVQPGDTFVATVSADGFREVTSAQFTLAWDPSVLKFLSVESRELPGISEWHFGTSRVGDGLLAFAWEDSQAAGLTLAEAAALFGINYEVIGGAGSVSTLSLGDHPTLREVGIRFTAVPVADQSGQIRVAGVTAPMISQVELTDGVFRLRISTELGQQYILESADSLPASRWTPVRTLIGDGNWGVLMDSATKRQQFYRVRVE